MTGLLQTLLGRLAAFVPSLPGRAVTFSRWIGRSEQLPAPPDEAAEPGPRPRSLVRWVLSSDDLERAPFAHARHAERQSHLAWVLASEKLPASAGEPVETTVGRLRFWRRLVAAEALPQLERAAKFRSPGPGFWRWLVASEACPKDTALPRRRGGGLLRWTVSAEECPEGPSQPPRRERGFLGWLLSSEDCPAGRGSPPERRSGFWRWLVSRENL